jgi:hypothetical protein
VLRVVSEKPEVNGWAIVCCGWCSGQMAARFVRPSVASQMEAATLSAHRSRALKGRPHNAGANAGEVRAGTLAAMSVELLAADMTAVRAALKAGKAAVYNHEYGLIPTYMRHQSGSFGHSACLAYWTDANGGMAGWFDPLAAQGSQGLWAKWSDLTKAAWGGSQHSITKLREYVPPTQPKPPEPKPPEPKPPEPPEPKPPEPPKPPTGAPCQPLPPEAVAGAWGAVAGWCAVRWAPYEPPPPPKVYRWGEVPWVASEPAWG